MAVSISIGITQNSQSIANNTSNVTVKVTAKWTYGSWNATGECTGSITIAGTKYSFSGIKFNTGQTTSGSQVIMTKTVNVSHNSDGKKTLSCSASFVTGVSSGTVTASASKTLTTIPRKSTLSVASSGTLGSSLSLAVTRKATSMTHTITYTCGNASGTICTKSSSTSLSWTPPYSLAKQNAGGSSVSVKLTITTYSGSTNIGSNSYTVSCGVPSSTLSASNGTLGTAQSLSISRKSSSFTHTITYKCGTASGTITSKTTDTSVSWTPPWSLAVQAAGKSSVSVTLTIATYLDGVKFGASKTKAISCTINSSTVSASNGTLGTAQTLTVSRKESYYHTIKYTCGSVSGTICTLSDETEIDWTPPVSLASQNTAGESVSITLTVSTWSGNSGTPTQIGGNKTFTFSCVMPEEVKPAVSIALSDTNGMLDKYGKYVKGKSVLAFTINVTTSYGAEIKSYNSTFDGKSYTKEQDTITALPVGDDLMFTTTVTDSRGRTATATATVSVYDYATPMVTDLVIRRCNKNSTSNSSGAYLAIDYSAVVTALGNRNTAKYILQYKKIDDAEYVTEELTSLENAYVLFGASTVIDAEPESAYDIILTIKDDFAEISKFGFGASVKKVWSMARKGLGFAIGKVAEYIEELGERFEVNWNARFYKDVKIDGKLDAFPVGSVFVTSTNESPASRLGGTWELVDKALKYAGYTSTEVDGLIELGAYVHECTLRVLVEGHRLQVRCNVSLTAAVNDANTNVGHLSLASIGITRLPMSIYGTGGTDGGNAMTYGYLQYDNGQIMLTETVSKDGSSIPAETDMLLNFDTIVSKEHMLDEFCDRFYWKRTA